MKKSNHDGPRGRALSAQIWNRTDGAVKTSLADVALNRSNKTNPSHVRGTAQTNTVDDATVHTPPTKVAAPQGRRSANPGKGDRPKTRPSSITTKGVSPRTSATTRCRRPSGAKSDGDDSSAKSYKDRKSAVTAIASKKKNRSAVVPKNNGNSKKSNRSESKEDCGIAASTLKKDKINHVLLKRGGTVATKKKSGGSVSLTEIGSKKSKRRESKLPRPIVPERTKGILGSKSTSGDAKAKGDSVKYEKSEKAESNAERDESPKQPLEGRFRPKRPRRLSRGSNHSLPKKKASRVIQSSTPKQNNSAALLESSVAAEDKTDKPEHVDDSIPKNKVRQETTSRMTMTSSSPLKKKSNSKALPELDYYQKSPPHEIDTSKRQPLKGKVTAHSSKGSSSGPPTNQLESIITQDKCHTQFCVPVMRNHQQSTLDTWETEGDNSSSRSSSQHTTSSLRTGKATEGDGRNNNKSGSSRGTREELIDQMMGSEMGIDDILRGDKGLENNKKSKLPPTEVPPPPTVKHPNCNSSRNVEDRRPNISFRDANSDCYSRRSTTSMIMTTSRERQIMPNRKRKMSSDAASSKGPQITLPAGMQGGGLTSTKDRDTEPLNGGFGRSGGSGNRTQTVMTVVPLRDGKVNTGSGANTSNDTRHRRSSIGNASNTADNRRRCSNGSLDILSDRSSRGNFGDAQSLTSFVNITKESPVPKKESFSGNMPVTSPLSIERVMMMNPDLRDQMMNNPNLREVMMASMVNGRGGGDGNGRGMRNQMDSRAQDTSVTSVRPSSGSASNKRTISSDQCPMLGDVGGYAAGDDNSISLIEKRKHQLSMLGRGAAGGATAGDGRIGSMPFATARNHVPKKSFMQRERNMDKEIRNHAKETMTGWDSRLMCDKTRMESKECNRMMSHSRPGHAHTVSMKFPPSRSSKEGMVDDNVDGNTVSVKNAFIDSNKNGINAFAAHAKKMARRDAEKREDVKTPKKLSNVSSTKSGCKEKAVLNRPLLKPKGTNNAHLSGGSKTSKVTAANTPRPDKPKRPFSSYNLFFQLEREFIMNEISEGRKPMDDPLIKDAIEGRKRAEETNAGEDGNEKKVDSATVSLIKEEPNDKHAISNPSTSPQQKPSDPKPQSVPSSSLYFKDPDLPSRYTHLRMDKHWYSVGHKQKRKHRKTEGSCGFIQLTKMVSARWKMINETDPHVKLYCQRLADVELSTYKKVITDYKKMVKKAESMSKTKALMKASVAAEKGWAGKAEVTDDRGVKIKGVDVLVGKANKTEQPDRAEGDYASAGGKETKKNRLNKESKEFVVQEEGSPTPNDRQTNPRNSDGGGGSAGGDDMSRLSDFARMRGPFPGALDTARGVENVAATYGGRDDMSRLSDFARMSGPFPGGLDTPRGVENVAAGYGGGSESQQDDAPGDGLSGLPPPPFAPRVRSMDEARIPGTRVVDSPMPTRESQLTDTRMVARARRREDTSVRNEVTFDGAATTESRPTFATRPSQNTWMSKTRTEENRLEARLVAAKEAQTAMVREHAHTSEFAEARSSHAITEAEVRRRIEARNRIQMGIQNEDRMSGLAAARMMEARDSIMARELEHKYAAPGETEARHRLQMEIEEGAMRGRASMLGNSSGFQQQRYRNELRMPRDSAARDSTPMISQDAVNTASGLCSPYNRKPVFLEESHFPPGGSIGAGRSSSVLQQHMINQFEANVLRGMPYGSGAMMPPSSTTDASAQQEQFDMEVERFLSGIGRKMKEKYRMDLMRLESSADPAGGGLGAAGAAVGHSGSLGAEETEYRTLRRLEAVAASFPNQMMDAQAASRAEMIADMIARNVGGDNSNRFADNQSNPEMMAYMMMGGNDGGGRMMRRPFLEENNIRQQHQEGGEGGDGANPGFAGHRWGANGPD